MRINCSRIIIYKDKTHTERYIYIYIYIYTYGRYEKMFQTKVVWFGGRYKKISLI